MWYKGHTRPRQEDCTCKRRVDEMYNIPEISPKHPVSPPNAQCSGSSCLEQGLSQPVVGFTCAAATVEGGVPMVGTIGETKERKNLRLIHDGSCASCSFVISRACKNRASNQQKHHQGEGVLGGFNCFSKGIELF